MSVIDQTENKNLEPSLRMDQPLEMMEVQILGDVSKLEFIRDETTHQILGIKEEQLKPGDDFHYDSTSKSSISMKRQASSASEVLGSVTYLPFKPPALDLTEKLEERTLKTKKMDKTNLFVYLQKEFQNLESHVPGTSINYKFNDLNKEKIDSNHFLGIDEANWQTELTAYINQEAEDIHKSLFDINASKNLNS
jgi:hypothetical protein